MQLQRNAYSWFNQIEKQKRNGKHSGSETIFGKRNNQIDVIIPYMLRWRHANRRFEPDSDAIVEYSQQLDRMLESSGLHDLSNVSRDELERART